MRYLLLILLSLGSVTPSTQTAVSVTAKPTQIFVERSDTGQHLNFDFILKNQTDEKLLINKIELSVLDASGKLAWREFYDEYGRNSLELAKTPALKKQSTALLYNPFHTFAADIPLTKLHYEFSFSSEDRKRYFKTELDVAPISYVTKTDLILPLRGRVLVWDGHDYNSHHRRFDYTQQFFVSHGNKTNFQRYGYDFVIVDEQGLIYKGQPRVNDDWYQARSDKMEDYYSFGVPIYAAGAGRVAFVHDAKPDNRQFDPADLEKDERAYAGNYIVVDHLNGEYSWFGHIKQGSARVKVGQLVKQGEVIAAVGAAGSSLFPHLHYELRNGGGAKEVEGLPSYFSSFRRILGARSINVRKGAINTGALVDWQPQRR
ncbi:MAG TPA: M23 family metallopeptidase [Pyrinomonadaceae bacterium]|nr:M23 family metallopeptidase [Pyrinomonadaceae bacterium]